MPDSTADNYFAIIPEWVLDQASPVAVVIYGFLARYSNKQSHKAWPSHDTLAERARVSNRTVRRAVTELVQIEALEVEPRYDDTGRQTSNHYRLLTRPPLSEEEVDTHDQEEEDTGDQEEEDTGDQEEVDTSDLQNRVRKNQSQKNQSHSQPRRKAAIEVVIDERLNDIPEPMDEMVALFGEPSAASGGTWARYQRIVNLARSHPPGEITRRAKRHVAGFGFACTVGSLEKRWDELGGMVAQVNTLSLDERKKALRQQERAEWFARKAAEEAR